MDSSQVAILLWVNNLRFNEKYILQQEPVQAKNFQTYNKKKSFLLKQKLTAKMAILILNFQIQN